MPTLSPASGPATADTGARLYTIGYEGYSRSAWLRVLQERSVTIVCDLRRNPVGGRSGFARAALSAACSDAGMRYEHLWQLGLYESDARGRSRAAARAIQLEDYRLRILPHQRASLDRIHDWLVHGETVALSSFERGTTSCHRTCVANYLEATYGSACVSVPI